MEFHHYDHTFLEIGRLGQNLQDHLIGGDQSTWGDGSSCLGEIHKLEPTLGQEGEAVLFINGSTLDLKDYDVDEAELISFVETNIKSKLSKDEMDFLLYLITSTYFGEKSGELSGFDIDEWPVENLQKRLGEDIKGRLVLHMNTRYDCSTSVSEDGSVAWLDEVNPDDDAQRLGVAK